MQLRSISKPTPTAGASESGAVAVEASPDREVLAGRRGAEIGEMSLAERHLIVRGKRAEPIPRRRVRQGNLETVIGADDRTRILETHLAPWRMICALEIESLFGSFIGTAWFAGPKTLITAGHCVFDNNQMGGWAQAIVASPGRSGADRPFGRLTATRFSSVDRWIQKQEPDYDIGCIHLDEAPEQDLGFFGVGVLPNQALEHALVNISGYPGDRGDGHEQFFHANRILRVGPRRIFYDVDTFGGQSGSPAWVYEDGSNVPIAVGIHAYGIGGTPADFGMTANSAPRVIPEVLEQIKAWVQQDRQ
jgi:V8-like Glu-specific endopeptidase